MDDQGKVHEIVVAVHVDQSNKDRKLEVTVNRDQEEGIAAISGRLRITADGSIYEHGWRAAPAEREQVLKPVRLLSSSYKYNIEGPGFHYHILVAEDDKLIVLGQHPFSLLSLLPDRVVHGFKETNGTN